MHSSQERTEEKVRDLCLLSGFSASRGTKRENVKISEYMGGKNKAHEDVQSERTALTW